MLSPGRLVGRGVNCLGQPGHSHAMHWPPPRLGDVAEAKSRSKRFANFDLRSEPEAPRGLAFMPAHGGLLVVSVKKIGLPHRQESFRQPSSPAVSRRSSGRRRRCRHGGIRRFPRPSVRPQHLRWRSRGPDRHRHRRCTRRRPAEPYSGQRLGIVERTPVPMFGQDPGGFLQRAQHRIRFEVPAVDHFAGEQRNLGGGGEPREFLQHRLGGPAVAAPCA